MAIRFVRSALNLQSVLGHASQKNFKIQYSNPVAFFHATCDTKSDLHPLLWRRDGHVSIIRTKHLYNYMVILYLLFEYELIDRNPSFLHTAWYQESSPSTSQNRLVLARLKCQSRVRTWNG